jgi:hypothetical protein
LQPIPNIENKVASISCTIGYKPKWHAILCHAHQSNQQNNF